MEIGSIIKFNEAKPGDILQAVDTTKCYPYMVYTDEVLVRLNSSMGIYFKLNDLTYVYGANLYSKDCIYLGKLPTLNDLKV